VAVTIGFKKKNFDKARGRNPREAYSGVRWPRVSTGNAAQNFFLKPIEETIQTVINGGLYLGRS
jgi:hypothetical protein